MGSRIGYAKVATPPKISPFVHDLLRACNFALLRFSLPLKLVPPLRPFGSRPSLLWVPCAPLTEPNREPLRRSSQERFGTPSSRRRGTALSNWVESLTLWEGSLNETCI